MAVMPTISTDRRSMRSGVGGGGALYPDSCSPRRPKKVMNMSRHE